MNKDVHDIDKIFKQSIDPLLGERSPAVWEILNARLDTDDRLRQSKKRFLFTRPAACTLLFMLLSVVIYDARPTEAAKRLGNSQDKLTTAGNKKTAATDQAFALNPVNYPGTQRVKLEPHAVVPLQGNIITATDKITAVKIKPDLDGYFVSSTAAASGVATTGAANNSTYRKAYLRNNTHTSGIAVVEDTSIAMSGINTALLDPGANLPVWLDKVNGKKNVNLLSPAKKNQSLFIPYWSVAALGAPEWTSYSLENDVDENSNGQPDEKAQILQRENHEPSFSAAIRLSYQFSKRWSLQAGLQFMKTSISISPQSIGAARQSDGTIAYKYYASSGYAYVLPAFGPAPVLGDSITATAAEHRLEYLSLPVGIACKIAAGRFTFAPAFGMSVNVLLSAKIGTVVMDAQNVETVHINKLQGTKPLYAGVFASLELQYQMRKRWSINFVPAFRAAVSPVTRSNAVKTYPSSFGAGIGVSYRL